MLSFGRRNHQGLPWFSEHLTARAVTACPHPFGGQTRPPFSIHLANAVNKKAIYGQFEHGLGDVIRRYFRVIEEGSKE